MTDDIKLQLERTQGAVTNKIIQDLIQDHAHERQRMLKLYHRYVGDANGVPVLTREFMDKNKVNNKMANDFFGEIVDTKAGYFLGQPISYNLDKESDNYEQNTEYISDFHTLNDLEDLDAETGKYASMMGRCGRLCYIDRRGMERVMLVPGWECIFVTDISIDETQYALRYYAVTENGTEKYRVEWYDDSTIKYYIGDQHGNFRLEREEPHLFDEVPLIEFANNDERLGDAEKVLSLIDGYDNTLSDVNSEIEQFRLAYLALYGMEFDDETLERAKKTGAFGMPDSESRMEFITKMLDDSIIEHHLDRLENNIRRFAKSVNLDDESFGGNVSGVAMKFKLQGLENKTIMSERKFGKALRHMFRVIGTAWEKKGIVIDANDVFFEFKRNMPLNVEAEADATMKLKGMVSEQTRLSLLSFVDDVEWEIQAMEEDNAGRVDLDTVEDEADEPTE